MGFEVRFPTGRDSATFWHKGTEVPSFSREKGTTGQAQNLATGRDRPGQPVKMQDKTWYGTITLLLSKSGMGVRWDSYYLSRPVLDCPLETLKYGSEEKGSL